MKNVSHRKKWNAEVVEQHMGPPLINLIKSKHHDNSDKISVELKLHRDSTSENVDLYEFKMALFENGKTEAFLFFVRNFNMNLEASRTLETAAKVQYCHALVCVKSLLQFVLMSAYVESANPLTV